MSFLGQIPGYYFDPERKKYFRLAKQPQTEGEARVSAKKENAKTRRMTLKQQLDTTRRESKERKTSIKRNATLQTAICRVTLLRELGAPIPRPDMAAWKAVYVNQLGWNAYSTPYLHLPRYIDYIGLFAYDSSSQGVVFDAYSSKQPIRRIMSGRPSVRNPKRLDLSEDLYALSSANDSVSGLEVAAGRHAVITQYSGGVIIAKMHEHGFEHGDQLLSDVMESYSMVQTVWSCTTNGFRKEIDSFVVGGSTSLYFFELHPTGSLWTNRGLSVKNDDDKTKDGVPALRWLDNNVLSYGTMDGSISLYDRRSEGTALRFRHPSCPTGIRSANSNHIVVAGILNSLAKYDIRMAREPIHFFPGYRNRHWRNQAFDVNTEMGIVAAGKGLEHVVQTWDVANGRPIKELDLDDAHAFPEHRPLQQVQCVRFIEKDGLVSILASEGKTIHRLMP